MMGPVETPPEGIGPEEMIGSGARGKIDALGPRAAQ